MWIIDVTGPKPAAGGNPPWVRFRRLPGELSEAEIEAALLAMASEHTAVRATRGGVEIVVTRQYRATRRMLEEATETT